MPVFSAVVRLLLFAIENAAGKRQAKKKDGHVGRNCRVMISFGENVQVIRGDDADAVSLRFVPVGWFVSTKASGVLNTGIYEGEDNRLVGTRTIPFSELTPEFLRQEVQRAIAEQVVSLLDSDALRDYLNSAARKNLRRF